MAPDAALMILKISFFQESEVWSAMQYAVENGAHVINGSLGWFQSVGDRAMWRMVSENTIAAGLVLVFSAGNSAQFLDPPFAVGTPGDVPDVITVGATSCSDVIAIFSSPGPVSWEDVPPYFDWPFPPGKTKPSVSAPGLNTESTSADCAGYNFNSGTSMAAPHVSGSVALLLEADPALDHLAVKDLLMRTALDLGDPGLDNTYGAGRVDAFAAVEQSLIPTCPADLDGDGDVDAADLGLLLGAWGPNPGDPADLDGNAVVDAGDLAILLGNWGSCR